MVIIRKCLMSTFRFSAFPHFYHYRPFMLTIFHCIIPPLRDGYQHSTQWLSQVEGMAIYGAGNGCFGRREWRDKVQEMSGSYVGDNRLKNNVKP